MRSRHLAAFVAALVIATSACEDSSLNARSTPTGKPKDGISGTIEVCAITTFDPEDMWIIRNSQRCGVTFTSKRRDARLAMIQIGPRYPKTGSTQEIGGRKLQPADSDYDRTVGISSFQFVERDTLIRVSTAGLEPEELGKLVAGIKIVSLTDWEARYPKN